MSNKPLVKHIQVLNQKANPYIGNPRFSDIVISNRCMLRCKMCTSWLCPPDSIELTFQDCKKFVSDLADFVDTPLEINIMGGEPLMLDWCLDLCSFIAGKGFNSIISTNAYLIDKKMAKRIADSKLTVLAISLETLKEETHDFLRGTKGVFAKVMKAIEYLGKYCRDSLAITILTIIMEKNLDDILELTEWVNNNDLFQNISFLALLETGLVHPRQNWFKRYEYAQLWPQDTNKVYRLTDELIQMKKNGYKIGNPIPQIEVFKDYYTDPDKFMAETEYRINDYIIDLDENGTIYLSGYTLGNIRKDNLKQLWLSNEANLIRSKIDRHGPGKRCCVINFMVAFEDQEEYQVRSHLKFGKFYMQKDNLTKAAEEFRQILNISPYNQEARHLLGVCYIKFKEWDKAIAECNYILDINPDNEYAHHGLGFCYREKKNFSKAIEELNKTLEINPQSEYAHHDLGFCYHALNLLDKAIAEFSCTIKINPRNVYAHHGLGLCFLDKGELSKAMNEFNSVLDIEPNNIICLLGAARIYFMQKKYEAALENFQKVLQIEPTNQETLYYIESINRYINEE